MLSMESEMHRSQAIRNATLLVVASLASFSGCSKNQKVEALLQVHQPQQPIFGEKQVTDPRVFDVYKQTQIALLTSPFVLNAACRSPEVRNQLKDISNPVQWLTENITVSSPQNSEIVSVAITSTAPSRAKILVDSVVQAYQEEIMISERTNETRRLDLLRATHRSNLSDIKIRSERAHKLNAALLSNNARETSMLVAELTEVRKQLVLVDVELAAIEKTGDNIDLDDQSLRDLMARQEALKEASRLITQKIKAEEKNSYSGELEVTELELASLRESTNELANEICRLEIALKAPPRIELIQNATITEENSQTVQR